MSSTVKLPNAIGIDLGTTNSCVGWWDTKKGSVEIIANEFGNRTTPSYVTFTPDGKRLVGHQSKKMQSKYPQQTIYESKRFIGRKFSELSENNAHFPFKVIDIGDEIPQFYIRSGDDDEKIFYPQEIAGFILDKMKKIAENYIGDKVPRAVITVPAYFNDAQRQATRDAGYIAQLEVLRVINEPTAAALAYGLDKKTETLDRDVHVLVFDLGGGTLDTSLLSIGKDGIFEVLSTTGDTFLGGADFDKEMMNLILDKVDINENREGLLNKPSVLRKLRLAAEQAKCELSSLSSSLIDVEFLETYIEEKNILETGEYEIQISRSEFEDRVNYLFTRCMNCVKQTLTDVNMLPQQVDDVVLVGGSTRIPKIQDLLSEYFRDSKTLEPKKLCKSINPDEAVAYGAALQAALLNYPDETDEVQYDEDGNEIEYYDENLPDILLHDVCPLSLGVETAGGLMTTIIPRNTHIPISKTKMFSTIEDFQTAVTVSVFEGERSETIHNRLLGEFELCGIPEANRGEPKIEVVFEIDADGIFTVSARDITEIEIGGEAGSYQRLHINHTTKRDSKDIEEMLNAAKDFEHDDEMFRKVVRSRMQFENFIYYIRNLLTKEDRVKENLTKEEKEEIEKCILEQFEWLKIDGRKVTSFELFDEKLSELTEFIRPIIENVNKRIQSTQK